MNKQLQILNILGVFILILLVCEIAWEIPAFHPQRVLKAYLLKTCVSDETAIRQAVIDIEKDKMCIVATGLMDVDRAKELEVKGQKYGFKAIGFGCMGAPKPILIYDQMMKRAINEKAQQFVFWTFDKYTLDSMKGRY
jgi:hypothetical protein